MLLAQIVANGLLLGGLYAAIAIGFSLIWGVLNLINMAHGSMVILGAYLAYEVWQATGTDPFLLLPVAGGALFLIGAALQHYVLNLVIDRSVFMTLVMSFGLNLILVNLLLLLFAADMRSASLSYAGERLELAGVMLPYARLGAFALAVALTLMLHLFLERTRLGNAIKSTSFDREAAQLVGIDVKRIYTLTFAIGAAMAGVSGVLISVVQAFSPVVGDGYTMKSFVVVVLGGLGNVPGALAAGLLLGVIENLATVTLGSGYSNALSFLLLLCVLVLRPRGIFGRAHYATVRAS